MARTLDTSAWKLGHGYSVGGGVSTPITLLDWMKLHPGHSFRRREIDEGAPDSRHRVLIVLGCLHRTHAAEVYVVDEVKSQETFS